MTLFDLAGQTALVTGGTGALGLALAEALDDAGATVAITGTKPEKVAAAAKGLGGPGLVADLSDRGALEKMFAEALERLGQIDILITAHGTITRRPALEY